MKTVYEDELGLAKLAEVPARNLVIVWLNAGRNEVFNRCLITGRAGGEGEDGESRGDNANLGRPRRRAEETRGEQNQRDEESAASPKHDEI
jgi:hypothetical protein